VGVPAAAGVAFGSEQHVLAERGQTMTAEWTAVRRRLAVRRATHRPPWGLWKTRGHGSIVPALHPLATALAVASVGVGIALVKAELGRRSERSAADEDARRRARRPSLAPGEPYAEGLRRVTLGQLDLAIELLEQYPGGAGERTVHETRKALKRLRALLRLLREELGAKRYARESGALRECARRLAGARDAEVMVATLQALTERHPERLERSPAVSALRAQLCAERDAASAHAIGDPEVRGEVVRELRAVRARVERWELRERGFELLAPGLHRVHRQGRRGLRLARRDADAEALHLWRKHVKDLRYAAETLDRGGKPSKLARRIARRADRLGEVLGEEHDLALLARGVRARSAHFAGERRTRKRLLKAIARRRVTLRKRALRAGERLYRHPPRRFVRRLRRVR
jgi:CHAD domain-containing protein